MMYGALQILLLPAGSTALTAGSISFVSKSDTVISLSASDATGGNTPYTYQWKIGNSPLAEGAGSDVGDDDLTLSATGLTPDTIYYFRLKYTDASASVVYSSQYSTATNAEGDAGTAIAASLIAGGFGFGINPVEFD